MKLIPDKKYNSQVIDSNRQVTQVTQVTPLQYLVTPHPSKDVGF